MKLLKPTEFPKLLKVRDAIYHVLLPRRLKEDDMGVCDDTLKLIMLSLAQDERELNATFFHEWLHAFEKEYSMKLGHRVIKKLEWALVELFEQLGEAP